MYLYSRYYVVKLSVSVRLKKKYAYLSIFTFGTVILKVIVWEVMLFPTATMSISYISPDFRGKSSSLLPSDVVTT